MAEDYTLKRREMASRAVKLTTALVDSIRGLKGLGEDLREVGGGFQDTDFEGTAMGTGLAHLNAWKLDTLLMSVVPALDRAADIPIVSDGPTARTILLAVKSAS